MLLLYLEAFGFCEYKEPESTLRALRLLHELLLGDKKLLVKVDAKTKAQLDEWKAKNRSSNGVCCSFNTDCVFCHLNWSRWLLSSLWLNKVKYFLVFLQMHGICRT